jgi:hypothetical protein
MEVTYLRPPLLSGTELSTPDSPQTSPCWTGLGGRGREREEARHGEGQAAAGAGLVEHYRIRESVTLRYPDTATSSIHIVLY